MRVVICILWGWEILIAEHPGLEIVVNLYGSDDVIRHPHLSVRASGLYGVPEPMDRRVGGGGIFVSALNFVRTDRPSLFLYK
jgi:hypothetical protein